MQRWILVLFFGAAFGLSVFVWLTLRATDVRQEPADRATSAFALAKAPFASSQPIIRRNDLGDLIQKSTRTAPSTDRNAHDLYILAYRAEEQRLSRTKIPLWFLRMKEAPLRFALGQTGMDLEDIDISIGELSQVGPQLVLDEMESSGDRVLIWTR